MTTNLIVVTLHKEVAAEIALAFRGHIDRLNEAIKLCSQNGVNDHAMFCITHAMRNSEEGLRHVEGKLENLTIENKVG